jgi:hypothetical protein
MYVMCIIRYIATLLANTPQVTFLNNVVMPDPDYDSDSEGEDQGTE